MLVGDRSWTGRRQLATTSRCSNSAARPSLLQMEAMEHQKQPPMVTRCSFLLPLYLIFNIISYEKISWWSSGTAVCEMETLVSCFAMLCGLPALQLLFSGHCSSQMIWFRYGFILVTVTLCDNQATGSGSRAEVPNQKLSTPLPPSTDTAIQFGLLLCSSCSIPTRLTHAEFLWRLYTSSAPPFYPKKCSCQ